MPSPTRIGIAKSRMPWSRATTLLSERGDVRIPRGMAKDNAKMIDENGDLHVTRILDGLDSLYGVSMMFQLLNAALCSLQQRLMESACA